MLKVENLSFAYRKGRDTIHDISLEINGNQICGLLGPNGAGKSTLLYLIAGLLTPGAGRVMLKGSDTRRRLPSTLEDIFIVAEEFTVPEIRVDEYARINSRLYPRYSADAMRRHLEIFEIDPAMNFGAMSMGQRKKAFMSFALACNTSLMLMDEPTNGLDIPGKSQFRRFIVSNVNEERAVLISTHQVRDIDKILDHLVMMSDSGILLNEPVSRVAQKLRFLTTDSAVIPVDALYSQPCIEGRNVILPADPGAEPGEVNLESLFEFAQSRPDTIRKIFCHE